MAAMITGGESRIESIVAVDWDGSILSPCGRCRELVVQVDDGNAETRVILRGGRAADAAVGAGALAARPVGRALRFGPGQGGGGAGGNGFAAALYPPALSEGSA